MLALTNGVILTGSAVLTDSVVLVKGAVIQEITTFDNIPEGYECIDLKGQYLSPGFIDLQLNGCGGVMFNDSPSVETLKHMQTVNLKSGTTSYLPTLISDSDDVIKAGIHATQCFMERHENQVLGMHLEGPYTNPIRKGIHPIEQLRQLQSDMANWLASQSKWLSKVTLAPEMNNPEVIQTLTNAGVIVSIGHSAASYEQTMTAFDDGIRFATHLYNAMTPTSNAREPGVVGAVFDHPEVYAGIIADGHHVHWANVRTAKKILGERLVLVTDATAGAMPPKGMTSFDFCGATIHLKDGLCIDDEGTLGGSSLTMDQGVRLLVQEARIPFDEAIRMATLYPARAIGVDDKLGSIETGYIANLIVLDQDYKVSATMVNGVFTQEVV